MIFFLIKIPGYLLSMYLFHAQIYHHKPHLTSNLCKTVWLWGTMVPIGNLEKLFYDSDNEIEDYKDEVNSTKKVRNGISVLVERQLFYWLPVISTHEFVGPLKMCSRWDQLLTVSANEVDKRTLILKTTFLYSGNKNALWIIHMFRHKVSLKTNTTEWQNSNFNLK